MLCKQIMKIEVECVSEQSSVAEAARIMRDRTLGFLPVCDEGKHVVGVVTDRDLALRVLAEGGDGNTKVESVLTPEVIACQPQDDVDFARELMARSRKSRIMCIDRDERLVGVISLSDIAQMDAKAGADTLRRISSREARITDH